MSEAPLLFKLICKFASKFIFERFVHLLRLKTSIGEKRNHPFSMRDSIVVSFAFALDLTNLSSKVKHH